MSLAELTPVKRKHVRNPDGSFKVVIQQGDSEDTYTYKNLETPRILQPNFNVSKVQDQYQKSMALFKGTDYYKKLVELFKGCILEKQSPAINRVLCLGIGSYSDVGLYKLNPYYQLAMVEVMLELLRCKYPIDDKEVYFQHNVYTKVDLEFLASRKFTVIEVPEGYNKITPTTLIYAPMVHWEVSYRALEMQYPTMWVGSNFDNFHSQTSSTESMGKHMKNDKTTVEKFGTSHKKEDMPAWFDHKQGYVAEAIYWNPPST
ncbi:hypothetical protein MMC11_004607 [Xylographa trunciseda]|nr:hypothetical protein [Xylographa trunciseda]